MRLLRLIRKGVRNPKLAMNYAFGVIRKPGFIVSYLARKKYRWIKSKRRKLKFKEYASYEEYLEHQEMKLDQIKDILLPNYDQRYRVELRRRLKQQNIIKPGLNILCLAARIGTEVKSFLDLGCYAVGIDLNPDIGNKYVLYGDFHDIQFCSNSVDVVFTNSLDHVFNLQKVVREIKRVLKPNGYLILEITLGEEEGYTPGYYEATIWGEVDDLLDIFIKSGFKIIKDKRFEFPWEGRHVSLVLKSKKRRKLGSKLQ